MIDTSEWKYVFKAAQSDILNPTNLMYTPLVNPEGTMLCMLWDENSPYLKFSDNTVSKELLDYFFEREVKHLTFFQKYNWTPKIIDIDFDSRKIIIDWKHNTINQIFMDPNRDLNEEVPDWKEQIFQILSDVTNEGYYKLALYPHCFFVDNGKIKTFDFYSCVGIEERYIKKSILEDMIGKDSTDRFNNSTVNGYIDFRIFFDITMNSQLSKTWQEDPFPEFYKKLNVPK